MSPAIASAAFACVILGLFWLDRDPKVRTSGALWIPTVWFAIACSRPISAWLPAGSATVDSADQVLEGSPVDRMVYTCLLAVGIGVLFARRQQAVRLLRANGPIILFVFYCAVSLLWSDYPDVAFKRWIRVVGDLVMIWIVLSDREPLAAVKRLLARATYVLIPLSILFIKYYPNLGVHYGPWGGGADYAGVGNNKNTLGAICMCFGAGALWRLLTVYRSHEVTGRTRRVIAQGVVLAMVIFLFGKINAMTATNTFLMAGVLLLATNSRFVIRRPTVVHCLIASMLITTVAVVFLGASPDALKAIGRNPTLTDRAQVWGVLLTLVRNPLLGTGFESFWLGSRLEKMWSLYWWHPSQAHNGYLEIFLNLGWVGIALLAIILATGYRAAFRAWRSNLPTGNLRLAYIFVGLVFNFTEAAFFRMQAPVWLFLLLAMTNVPALSYRSEPSARNVFQHPDSVNREQGQLIRCEDVI